MTLVTGTAGEQLPRAEMLQITFIGDRQHCNTHFDDEPIRMDADYLALGEKHDELFRWIELASFSCSVRSDRRLRDLSEDPRREVRVAPETEEWFE